MCKTFYKHLVVCDFFFIQSIRSLFAIERKTLNEKCLLFAKRKIYVNEIQR